MEGKAMLMKYLGGVDAIALCIDSKDKTGEPSATKIINFVKMLQPSFGAINLEDISQPNCFKVLDVLREECDIPVWHDDAQGTACVTLAGIINALKLVDKKMSDIKVVLYGAGASNTSIARLMIADGADPKKIILFDSRTSLHRNNKRYQNDPRFYRQWELCQTTNPNCITDIEEAFSQADVLVALSKPGPDTVQKEWTAKMADKAIVFVCSNPIPEIYPYAAKEAGAYIVATGRGDFPNQVNNSVCFPSILKGALLVHAHKISDGMAITAAHAIAQFAEDRGITTEDIIPKMTESDLFPLVATEVALKAIEEGHARINLSREEIFAMAKQDIEKTHAEMQLLMDTNFIQRSDPALVQKAVEEAVEEIGS
jgi:malate dehydrogenase (oxaloacetate-decarboxylating)